LSTVIACDEATLQADTAAEESPSLESGYLIGATALRNWDEVQKLPVGNRDLDIHTTEARLTFLLALAQEEWSVLETIVEMGIDPNGKSAHGLPACNLRCCISQGPGHG
jgi:hypothetical protein